MSFLKLSLERKMSNNMVSGDDRSLRLLRLVVYFTFRASATLICSQPLTQRVRLINIF